MQRRGPQAYISPLLQPPLHKLFVPRPFPDYLPPTDLHKDGYRGPRVGAVAPFLAEFGKEDNSGWVPTDSLQVQRTKRIEAKRKAAKEALDAAIQAHDPKSNPSATADPIKTLFVGRLSYDVTERQLKREFEIYGEIVSLKLVTQRDNPGKPRGYAFIEFGKEEEMRAAFKDADAKKINGRRIVVDVERGRTVEGWLPRRLGGGLGQTRAGGSSLNRVYSGRDPRAMPSTATEHHQEQYESLPRKRDRSPSPGRRRDADRFRSSGYHDRHHRR